MRDIENVLRVASTDSVFLAELIKDPARLFIPVEMQGDIFLVREFNKFAEREIVPLALAARNGDDLPTLTCAACKTGAFLIGAAIVALTAAGLSSLTVSSSIVLQLAAFAGVSTTASLAFIISLGATIAGGISEVVDAICVWMEAC